MMRDDGAPYGLISCIVTYVIPRNGLRSNSRSALRDTIAMGSRVVLGMHIAAALLAASVPLRAQERPTERGSTLRSAERVGGIPREVLLEVQSVWNTPGTRRVHGDFAVAAGDTLRGDLAMLGGRLRIAGVVLGRVYGLNGDVALADGSRIDGTVTVLGGALDAADRLPVSGDVRVWRSRFRYKESGDSLIVEPEREVVSRWPSLSAIDDSGAHAELFLTSGHTYNRVEGLPLYGGPRFGVTNGDTRLNVELFGVFRTGNRLRWERENLGHRVFAQLQRGTHAGVRVGGRLFDVVDAVEQWQLSPTEVGLSSFIFTRDYRDYWQRHGAAVNASVFAGDGTELRAEFGEERWSSRRMRDVWSLFGGNEPWRLNPAADEGVMHLGTVTARIDTRNNRDNPRSGWLLFAEIEHGAGTLDVVAPTTVGVRDVTPGKISYTRGLLDVRRYNRLAPRAQVNVRAVLGGWLGGDALPVERRFAVSGIDALPGFDFRRTFGTSDVGSCATGSDAAYAALGRPALCERILLLQVEWKGDFRVRLFGDRDWFGDSRWTTSHFSADGSWVLFANSGRGWLVHGTDQALVYGQSRIPELHSWRTDLGGGFDFGSFGIYVAESVSRGALKPNVYLRLGHRF